ncbi:flavin reductase [Vallitalea longa]|uniref:Flavin reductase n=1 Tax=Vallitalea longa TaxID=2936439 RepID=A0A9W5YE47_9FIRM|nr:NAD(P)H-dependent oxidoreductase [Vallitalea longa]GKX30668.1 flavin reductase [Vallitalea longa]
MNITVVYGTERKGCTYNIAQQVINQINNAKVTEIFLPRDLPEFCISCLRCFSEKKGNCTHSDYTISIRKKLLAADLIILTSPVYSYHVTGQMKVFLDHFANMWMVHRPERDMFRKQGLVIATASGPVYRKSLKEMKDSLDFWGVAKTYKMGCAVFECNWKNVSPRIKEKVSKKTKKIADKVIRNNGKVKPCFRVRKWFLISSMLQKHIGSNPVDVEYWREQGWLNKKRPWKN